MDGNIEGGPSTANSYWKIEAKPPSGRYARGWYCLGAADQYTDGKPHTLEAFGTKLVVFQGESGRINVINGYCPHMGGDLGEARSRAIPSPARSMTGAGPATAAAR